MDWQTAGRYPQLCARVSTLRIPAGVVAGKRASLVAAKEWKAGKGRRAAPMPGATRTRAGSSSAAHTLGESSEEDPSVPPSLPAISAPVSAPKWLPPTNRCDSIPAELCSARARRSPGHGACRPPPNPDLTAPAARPHPSAAASAKFL